MRLFIAVLCFLVSASVAHAANTVRPKNLLFKLERKDIAGIEPKRGISRKEFDEGDGQFEVLIPKERFIIPAPNCRKNVILRMWGVRSDARDREEQLTFRWQLLQSIYAVARHGLDHVDVAIKIGPAVYQRINRHGQRELEYCNAFIPGK